MPKLKLISGCLCLLFLSSCATLFTSRQQNITFDSNEKDVHVYINGEKICETPCVVKIDRSRDTMLIVGKKDGFNDAAITVESGVNLVTVLNVITMSTGSFGLSTDITNSHAWEYKPNAFYLTMEEKEENSPLLNVSKAKKDKIRKYILMNYSDIKAAAVYESEEEYLETLVKITSIPIDKLEDLAIKSKDEAELVDLVMREYKKK